MESTLLHSSVSTDFIPHRELNNTSSSAFVPDECSLSPLLLADMKRTPTQKKMNESHEFFLPHHNGSLRILETYEKVLEFILAEERATGMHFIGHRKEGIFDRIGKDLKAFIGEGRKHIRYYVTSGTKGRGYDPIPVEYTGVPFIEAGTYVMDCHMGNDSGLWIKKRYAEKRDKLEKENSQCVVKRRTRTLESKKTGCPAKIHIKRILRLPEFKIEKSTVTAKEKNRLKIIQALKSELETVQFRQEYYVLMPGLECHRYHAANVVAGMMVSKTKDGELHLKQIRNYLENRTYLPSVGPNEKKNIRTAAKTFSIEGSVMYYIGEDGSEKRIVLYTTVEKQKAFDEFHVLCKSGEHLECTQTLLMLKQKYYWMSMSEDVVTMIQRCHVCEHKKVSSNDYRSISKKKYKNITHNRQSIRGRPRKRALAGRNAGQEDGVKVKVEVTCTEEDIKTCSQQDLVAVQKQPFYKSDDQKFPNLRDKQHGKGSLRTFHLFQEALHFIREEEKATGVHFIGHRKEGVFDKDGHDLKVFVRGGRKHIRYCITLGTKGRGYDPVPVEYTGVPFIEAGTYVMECHLGMDTGIWNKRRYAARRDRIEEEEITAIKRRSRMYDTKKMGCPAKVHIKRILRLPDFKICQNTPAEREKNRKRIISAVGRDIEAVNFQTEYYVLMPDLDCHKFHTVDIVAGVLVTKGEGGSQHLNHVRHYLETGTHARTVPLHRKKSIRKSAKEFMIEDGVMYYQGKTGREKRFVPATEEEKLKAFREAHILKSSQHCSKIETVRRLLENCYWTDLNEDAQENVDKCQVCALHKLGKFDLKSSSQTLQPYKVEDRVSSNQLCTHEVVMEDYFVAESSQDDIQDELFHGGTTVSTFYEMSDGGSLVVVADDTLNVEEVGQKTHCRHITINIS
ncbi:uncharacterized protein LOC122242456 [Penaeus japonicus]|uniref:uncharacterized protein LOC122242456 n=1 Tax=Penaeus japonicus TaxID=27405 RepID=UPI001C70E099|nr:uncharacterized protein LOC122242456 [Penaeus japonicus]